MSDGNDAAARQDGKDRLEPRPPDQRKQRLASLTVIITLVGALACVGAGTVLLNMDWPNKATSWVRLVFGAILAVVGTTLADIGRKQLTRYFKNRKRDPDSRYSPLLLDVVDRINRIRLTVVVVVAASIFVVAVALPPLLSPQVDSGLEPGPILIKSSIDESPTDPRHTLIDQWNATHPENPVKFLPVSGETDQQHENMVDDAKRQHDADVYLLDVVWMKEFVTRGYIRPIDQSTLEQDTSDFLTNVLNTCRAGEDSQTLWGLPFHSDAGLMYYRSDLVSVAPQTWAGYFGTPAKDTLRSVRNGTAATPAKAALESACSAQLENEEVLTVTALEAMFAAGSKFVNPDGEVLMKNENEVAFDRGALAALSDLAAAAGDPAIVLPDSRQADEETSMEAMRDGRALFMRNWPVSFDQLVRQRPHPTASFGVASLPWGSVLGGQNLAIASSTDKPRAVQALIEFLTSRSSQLMLFDSGGYAPTRNSAFIDSRRPYRNEVRDAVEHARPRPSLVNYTEFSKEFRAGVLRAMKDGGKIEQDLPTKLADIINQQ